MASLQAVSVPSICANVTTPFSQTLLANLDGSFDIKHALLDGSVPFHSHPDNDEAFYLLSGKLTIEIQPREKQPNDEDGESVQKVELKLQDLFVVPRGVVHRPVGIMAHVLIMEKVGIPGGNGEKAKEIKERITEIE